MNGKKPPKPTALRWREWYAALKERDAETFSKAMHHAEGFALTYDLPLEQGAELERSFIMFACELLHVTLPPSPVEAALASLDVKP